MYQNLGIDLKTMFIAYTLLSLLCFARTVLLMGHGMTDCVKLRVDLE